MSAGNALNANIWDIDKLSATAAAALLDNPLAQWLVPQEGAREQVLADVIEAWITHARTHGLVHTNEARDAVAVWLSCPGGALVVPADYNVQLARAAGHHAERFAVLTDAMARNPLQMLHHRLLVWATHPTVQGRGEGVALALDRIAALSDMGIAVRVDWPEGPSLDFLVEAGFTDHGEPYELPDSGPTIHTLVRMPPS